MFIFIIIFLLNRFSIILLQFSTLIPIFLKYNFKSKQREKDFLAINASIVTQRRRIFPSSARNLFAMMTQISLEQFRIALDYWKSTVLQNCNSFEKWISWSSQFLQNFSNNCPGILLRIATLIYKTDSKVSTCLDCNVIFLAKPFKNTQTSYLRDD